MVSQSTFLFTVLVETKYKNTTSLAGEEWEEGVQILEECIERALQHEMDTVAIRGLTGLSLELDKRLPYPSTALLVRIVRYKTWFSSSMSRHHLVHYIFRIVDFF